MSFKQAPGWWQAPDGKWHAPEAHPDYRAAAVPQEIPVFTHFNGQYPVEALLEAAPDAMVIVDGTGQIVLINAQTERLFGYGREELLGRHVELLVPERFREHHGAYREDYSEDPHTRSMGAGLELYGRRKDGSEFPVEISLAPLETEDGTLVSSAIRDITDRKRADDKFRALLESAPDAMVIVGSDGVIQLVNAQTEHLFGYPRDELVGERVEILVPDGSRGRHPAASG